MKISLIQFAIAICALMAASSCVSTNDPMLNSAKTMALQFSEDSDALRASLQAVVDAQIGRKNVHEIALSLSTGANDTAIHLSAAKDPEGTSSQPIVNSNTPFFTASTSKLFATTLVLQLVDEGKLSLEDSIVEFFPDGALDGLHETQGRDRTADISVRQLMAHTSGIGDYFEDKLLDGSQLVSTIRNNQDSAWSVADVIDTVKTNLPPHFSPGASGKAHYSDTNFQLLGAIIENVTQKSLVENIDNRIANPLKLQNTYLYTQESTKDRLPVLPMRFKQRTLNVPMVMESVRLDGGIVSSSADSLKFIQAFMQGELFDSSHLADLQQWKSIGFPLQAGVGILRFKFPRIFSLFGRNQDLIGHSGISGAFAFYSPSSNVYLAGTINQLEDQTLPYKFMLKVVQAAKTK